MASQAEQSVEVTIQGIGCSRKRKEDPRFIQGKGNYVDDIKLPGTLFMDVVRSPSGVLRAEKRAQCSAGHQRFRHRRLPARCQSCRRAR